MPRVAPRPGRDREISHGQLWLCGERLPGLHQRSSTDEWTPQLIISTIALDDILEKGIEHLLGLGRQTEVKILWHPSS
jgi:hypothetical protein